MDANLFEEMNQPISNLDELLRATGKLIIHSVDIEPAAWVPQKQHIHSYTMATTQSTRNAIDNAVEDFHRNTRAAPRSQSGVNTAWTNRAVGNIMGASLDYRVDENGLAIPLDWDYEYRGMFTIELEVIQHNIHEFYYIKGHCSDYRAVPNGRHGYSLAPDCRFWANEVSKKEITPTGEARLTETIKEIRPPELEYSQSTYPDSMSGRPEYATMAPCDIVSFIGFNSLSDTLSHDGEQMPTHVSSIHQPVATQASHHSPIDWMADVVSSYQYSMADARMSTSTYNSGSLHDVAINTLLSPSGNDKGSTGSYIKDPLLLIFSMLRPSDQGVSAETLSFEYQSLLNLDPSVDDRTRLPNSGIYQNYGRAMFTDEYGNPIDSYCLKDFHSTGHTTPAAMIGNMVAQTLGSIFTRAGIVSVSNGHITTQTQTGELWCNLGEVLTFGANAAQNEIVVTTASNRVYVELGPLLTPYEGVDITNITFWGSNMISMTVRVGDAYPEPFATMLWCDGTLSPLLIEKDSNRNDPQNVGGYASTISVIAEAMEGLTVVK